MNVKPYANNATLFLRISVSGGRLEQLERRGFGRSSDDDDVVLGNVIDGEGTRGVDGKARAREREMRGAWAERAAELSGGREGGGGGGRSTGGRHRRM